jgi:hypothetical protein
MTLFPFEQWKKEDAWADKDLTDYWSYPEIDQEREEDDAEES